RVGKHYTIMSRGVGLSTLGKLVSQGWVRVCAGASLGPAAAVTRSRGAVAPERMRTSPMKDAIKEIYETLTKEKGADQARALLVALVRAETVDAAIAPPEAGALLDELCALAESHNTGAGETRRESLRLAIEAGAPRKTLEQIAEAVRVKRCDTITLPPGRYERLSRGRGWARKGKGASAEWGERVDGGYRVGPGRWSVGSSDGFNRKSSTDWSVEHVAVGSETWTIAS